MSVAKRSCQLNVIVCSIPIIAAVTGGIHGAMDAGE